MAMKGSTLVLILLGIFLAYQMNWFGGGTTQTVTQPPSYAPTSIQPQVVKVDTGCNIEDVTVTFSSWDYNSVSTNAGTGHRLLQFNTDRNIQVADDGTKQYSVGDEYIVLIGNLTTSLVGGTNYYPVPLVGSLEKCKGTATVSVGQYKAASNSSLTFTYWNKAGTANTAQAITSNDDKTIPFKFEIADNVCWGNKAVENKVQNTLCMWYNTSAWTTIELMELGGTVFSTTATPNSMGTQTSYSLKCFSTPMLCDNGEFNAKVHLKSGTSEITAVGGDIRLALSDGTVDYDSDTLALIYGVQDEDMNDIGVPDIGTVFANSIYNITVS